MSISPELKAVNLCFAERGENFTAFLSPKTATATALAVVGVEIVVVVDVAIVDVATLAAVAVDAPGAVVIAPLAPAVTPAAAPR